MMRRYFRTIQRVWLAAWLVLAAAMAGAEPAGAPPAAVVFVCEHGNVKSLMAASYFNQLAQARSLPFAAVARGTAPDSDRVPPAIVAGLRRQGVEVAGYVPRKLAAQDLAGAARVVTIGLPRPLAGAGILAWDDVPPASTEFEASSAALKTRVEELLVGLIASSKKQAGP
ncbi:MAG: arsenate reductase/protein-tyrosine-phosphatase family protein [Telluria sp.]